MKHSFNNQTPLRIRGCRFGLLTPLIMRVRVLNRKLHYDTATKPPSDAEGAGLDSNPPQEGAGSNPPQDVRVRVRTPLKT